LNKSRDILKITKIRIELAYLRRLFTQKKKMKNKERRKGMIITACYNSKDKLWGSCLLSACLKLRKLHKSQQ